MYYLKPFLFLDLSELLLFSNNSVANFRLDSRLYPTYNALSNSIKKGFSTILNAILQHTNVFNKMLSISLILDSLSLIFSKLSVV
jgi:hypothetical protein